MGPLHERVACGTAPPPAPPLKGRGAGRAQDHPRPLPGSSLGTGSESHRIRGNWTPAFAGVGKKYSSEVLVAAYRAVDIEYGRALALLPQTLFGVLAIVNRNVPPARMSSSRITLRVRGRSLSVTEAT